MVTDKVLVCKMFCCKGHIFRNTFIERKLPIMKKVKLLTSFILIICIVSQLCAMGVFADSYSRPINCPFTQEEWESVIRILSDSQISMMSNESYWQEQAQYEAEAAAAFERAQLLRDDRNHTLSVTLFQQENEFFCGPASIKMIMSYFGHSVSQTSIANSVMEDLSYSNGKVVSGYSDNAKMASYLKNNTGCTSYSTRWVSSSKTPYYEMWYSIRQGRPVIASVSQNMLPNNNGSSSSGHIIVVKGFYNEGQPNMSGGYYYNDPHYNNNYYGSYSCSAQVMYEAINANQKYFIAG